MMPEMDGFAVVAALQKKADWRDIPVIVITSLDLDAKDRERLNAGVQFVLVKERFRPADLVERIRRLVLKMRLELLGDFEVLTAEDGEKACEVAAAEQPDIILIDLEMPSLTAGKPR